MFVRGHRLLTDVAVERAKRESAETTIQILKAQMDFLCIRVNQLELERAALLQSIAKVPLPVPSLRSTASTNIPQPISDIFSDLGEDDSPSAS